MSIAYQSSDSSVQHASLKWQTLLLKITDTQIVSAASFVTTTPVIDVKQPVCQDAASGSPNYVPGTQPVVMKLLAAGGAPAVATAVSVSGTTITPTFAVAPVSGDCIMVNYVINDK